MKRLAPNMPFPDYLFIPGVNTHPKKDGGYMFEKNEPVAPSQLFLYGMFNVF